MSFNQGQSPARQGHFITSSTEGRDPRTLGPWQASRRPRHIPGADRAIRPSQGSAVPSISSMPGQGAWTLVSVRLLKGGHWSAGLPVQVPLEHPDEALVGVSFRLPGMVRAHVLPPVGHQLCS